MSLNIVFVGLSGYDYPHTRVRCYNFAEQFDQYPGVNAHVISLRDHCSSLSEVEMYEARDRTKFSIMTKMLPRVFPRFNTYFYIQKAHYNSALPYLLSRMGFNKYFFDYDDFDVDMNVTFNRLSLRRLFYGSDDHRVITENLARNAMGCIAASHSLLDYVKKFNPRVEYVPTGVRLDKFEHIDRKDHTDPIRFIWTGLVWGDEIYRSVLRAFEGMRAVKNAGHKARLELVGGGQFWDKIIESIGSEYADIAQQIDVTGWMHPDDMPNLLARADVGLLPFAEDSMWVRSKSPTKLYEYMASGLPVIADAIGEVNFVIEHEKSGILASDQDVINQSMIQMVKDKQKRLAMGTAARKRVETHFSIPVIVDRLAKFIEMIVRLRK